MRGLLAASLFAHPQLLWLVLALPVLSLLNLWAEWRRGRAWKRLGNLLALDWTGGPIEILFIDLAKSWDLNRWVLTKTFPRLIPGHSVVIQQDWVHFA